jgi:dTMP kinase
MVVDRGYFITFEGVDGSGKSTQAKRLAERLTADGHDVVYTREPGGSDGAELIREIVLSGKARDMGANMEALLFAAARADHVKTLIEPSLQAGKLVISDRFYDSTRAYQAAGDEADDKFVSALEAAAAEHTKPDLTIILNLTAKAAEKRMKGREGAQDRFESDQLRTFKQRQSAFLAIAKAEPDRCLVFNANRSEDAIAADIWKKVADRLPAPASKVSNYNRTLSRLRRGNKRK